MKRKIALIAFGGNAILPNNKKGLQKEQMKEARKAASLMIDVVKKGFELIIVHGNGPQVGNLLLAFGAAKNVVPAMPLDI